MRASASSLEPYQSVLRNLVAANRPSVDIKVSERGVFLHVQPIGYAWGERRYGWKLRVSATVVSAVDALRAVVPALVRRGVPFKVVSSREILADLNYGSYGYSQIGKFLTAYPANDAEFTLVASELLGLTSHVVGPRVPSDRQVSGSGCLFCRYGEWVMPEEGRGDILSSAVKGNNEARLAPIETRSSALTYSNLRPLRLVRRSGKGLVFLAAHEASGRLCVAKQFFHLGCVEPDGTDAVVRGRWHAACLSALNGLSCVPSVIDAFNHGLDFVICEEFVGGETLFDISSQIRSTDRARAILCNIIQAVREINLNGVQVNDLSPHNIVVAGNATFIVDFDRATGEGSPRQISGMPPYCLPVGGNLFPEFAADYYAVGALAAFLGIDFLESKTMLVSIVEGVFSAFEAGYKALSVSGD